MPLTKVRFGGLDASGKQFFGIGGTVTEYSSNSIRYRVHSFTANGTHKIVFNGQGSIDFLLVGGGGGSAAAEGYKGSTGGAGAGGMVEGTSQTITAGSYEVVVGGGGSKSTNISAPAENGDGGYN